MNSRAMGSSELLGRLRDPGSAAAPGARRVFARDRGNEESEQRAERDCPDDRPDPAKSTVAVASPLQLCPTLVGESTLVRQFRQPRVALCVRYAMTPRGGSGVDSEMGPRASARAFRRVSVHRLSAGGAAGPSTQGGDQHAERRTEPGNARRERPVLGRRRLRPADDAASAGRDGRALERVRAPPAIASGAAIGPVARPGTAATAPTSASWRGSARVGSPSAPPPSARPMRRARTPSE